MIVASPPPAAGGPTVLGSWEWDVLDDRMRWSDEVYRILGLPDRAGAPDSKVLLDAVHPDERESFQKAIDDALEGMPCDMVHRLRSVDGCEKQVRHMAAAIFDESGEPLRLIGTLEDITAREAAPAGPDPDQAARYRALFEETPDAVLLLERRRIVECNRAALRLFGCPSPDRLHGKGLGELSPRDQLDGTDSITLANQRVQEALERGRSQFEWTGRRQDTGTEFPAEVVLSRLEIGGEQIVQAVVRDMTLFKEAERKLIHEAHHDPLTELPNRRQFEELLNKALSSARRQGRPVAVIFLDLDGFKRVNDSLGHHWGDALLQSVAERLKQLVRVEDTVGRLGGDEFTILVEHLERTEDVAVLAERVVAALGEPHEIAGRIIRVSASLGISISNRDGETAKELLGKADAAMYRAKEEGRNMYRFYTEDLTHRARERERLRHELHHAIENGQFVLQYQPQIELADGRLAGVEALVRWDHAERGLLSPHRFIPLAEESGQIVRLGEWVLRSACRQAKLWLDDGIEFGRVAINLGSSQIECGQLVETVRKVLGETGLPGDRLELEVAEEILGEWYQARRRLHPLRELGVRVAVDHYGTSCSSALHFRELPIDQIKIDKSFVRHLPDDDNAVAVVRAMIAMARALNLTVIAEGVERDVQPPFLRREGCHRGQGYYWGRPQTLPEFSRAIGPAAASGSLHRPRKGAPSRSRPRTR